MPPARTQELLAAVFGEAAEQYADDLTLLKCQSYWPDIAGGLARHCQPVRLRGDRLIVRVEKSVYAQDLQLLSREIIQKANRLTGRRLRGLKLETGAMDWTPAGGHRYEPPQQSDELTEAQQAHMEHKHKLS